MFRRNFLLGLAALSLTPASGCALLQRESEVDALFNELALLLGDMPDPDRSAAQAIAAKLQEKTSQLVEVHRDFLVRFNNHSVDRQATPDSLMKISASYNEQRISLRNQMLFLQDDLYRALPEPTWTEVRDTLNRTSDGLSNHWRAS